MASKGAPRLASQLAWVWRRVWKQTSPLIPALARAFFQALVWFMGRPVLIEEKGAVALPGLDFTLTGKPDRIDLLADGRLYLIDYKTGAPPTKAQQKHFDKQLFLTAAMAEGGGFKGLDPTEVAKLSFVGLKADLLIETTDLQPGELAEVWV